MKEDVLRVVSSAINTPRQHWSHRPCRPHCETVRVDVRPAMSGLARVLKDKAPVLVFSGLCAGAAYAVYYAHHQQITEKKTMRQGVINDIKRDRIRQREMQQQQQQQQ